MNVLCDVAGGAEVGRREPPTTSERRQLRDADSAGHSAVAAQTGITRKHAWEFCQLQRCKLFKKSEEFCIN